MNITTDKSKRLMAILFCAVAVIELVAAVITKSNHGSARALWIILIFVDLAVAGVLMIGSETIALLGSYILINFVMSIPFSLVTKGMFDKGDVLGTLIFVFGLIVGLVLVAAAFLHFFSSTKLGAVIKVLNAVSAGLMAFLAAYAVFAINFKWWRFYIRKFLSNGYLIGGAAFVLTLALVFVMTLRYIDGTKAIVDIEIADKASSVVSSVEEKLSEMAPTPARSEPIVQEQIDEEQAVQVHSDEEPTEEAASAEAVPEQKEPKKAERMGKVKAISGSVEGEGFRLPQKNEIIIGKDPSQAHWIIKEDPVSRKHCSLRYQALENIYIVTDYSTNGTFADGERLEKDVPTPLLPGTVLTFRDGETKIQLG